MRVVLAGGGTAGHVFPALSVAACLAGHELLYCGSAAGPEARLVPPTGIPFHGLAAGKLARAGSPLAALQAGAASARGVLEALRLFRRWRPQAVLVTGGFASTGAGLAAVLLDIPLVVHEANAVPGRSNRLLGRFARDIAVSYPGVERWFPGRRVTLTGMPVREGLAQTDGSPIRQRLQMDDEAPLLLVTGGSLGSQALNQALLAGLPKLLERGVTVLHQTGARNFDDVCAQVMGDGKLPPNYHPFPFDPELPAMQAAAGVVVCRAGSSTLAELCILGRPSILVPLPSAVADHQTGNARVLAEAGAAVLLPEAELTGERLRDEALSVLCNPESAAGMSVAAKGLARPHAAQAVADLLLAS